MPYFFSEEIPEGFDSADVVDANLYNDAITQRDDFMGQLDTALGRVSDLETQLIDAKSKYADAILSAGVQQKKKEVQKESPKVQTFKDLFSERK